MGYPATPGPSFGTLYAIDRSTGKVAYTIQNSLDRDHFYAAYRTTQNVVLGSQNDALVVVLDNTVVDVVSFDLGAKSIRWRTSMTATGAMAVADGKLYVPASNAIYVLDEATGARLGQITIANGQVFASNVVVTANLIFAASA